MSTLIRIALFALALVAGAAQAADPLVISSGNDRAIPIAVVPFGFQGATCCRKTCQYHRQRPAQLRLLRAAAPAEHDQPAGAGQRSDLP